MLSYVFSSGKILLIYSFIDHAVLTWKAASSYFSYLPDDDEEDHGYLPSHSRRISWEPAREPLKPKVSYKEEHAIINQVNLENDL
jgi:hypothetical protein